MNKSAIDEIQNWSTAQKITSIGIVWLIYRGLSTSKKTPSFYPIVNNPQLRGQDDWGNGSYGASRTNSTGRHNGIDIISYQGQAVYAPIDCYVKRISNPYSIDTYPNRAYLTGLYLIGEGEHTGIDIKLWYFSPAINIVHQHIKAGTLIGSAQSLVPAFNDKMTNHLHLEVTKNGRFVDPTPWVFFTNV